MHHGPDQKYSWDNDPRMRCVAEVSYMHDTGILLISHAPPIRSGLDGQNLLIWRWLCATGVYHAAANSLSLEMISLLAERDDSAEEWLCKHQHVWSEGDRYFDRCAAGLGMVDAEHRIAKVKSGQCKMRTYGKPPSVWEQRQDAQFGDTLPLSCNPASPTTGYTTVMATCPAGTRMHFPCNAIAQDPDHKICTGEWFGTYVKAVWMKPEDQGDLTPFHRLCAGHDVLRRMFECTEVRPPKPGINEKYYALEWSKDHPGQHRPWNVIDWYMGTRVGVWGGTCTWYAFEF